MLYSIGIFFCAVLMLSGYMLLHTKARKRGKFDVRGAKLDYEALIWHAGQLARNQELALGRSSIKGLVGRVTDNYRHILDTYKKLSEAAAEGKRITGADEWLLDNFYIIEEQAKDLLQTIQSESIGKLPVIIEGQYTGFPRIFAIAIELVNYTDSSITEQSLTDFISEYQKTAFLTDTELWSLSSMLKIALIENISHLCDRINKTHSQYKLAQTAIDHIFNKDQRLDEVLGQYFKSNPTENSSLIEHLVVSFKKNGAAGSGGLRYIDARLGRLNTGTEKIIAIEHQKQTTRQVSMGNAITSLKFVLALGYIEIFEHLSQVENILGGDVSGIYPKMDKKTKNYYRKHVERIAKKRDISEIEVALGAVELSKAENRHIGHYLVETDLGDDNSRPKRQRQVLYWSSIGLITLFITSLLTGYACRSGGSFVLSVFVCLLTLLPASDIAVTLCNYMASHMSRVSTIPRLELTDGIPDEYRTLVVISALLPNADAAKKLSKQLEIYYLANRQDNILFGVLGDFADGKDEVTPEDNGIITAVRQVIDDLNAKYGDRFCLLHRRRTYDKRNNSYMGWERKRGAIVELCRLLRGHKDTSFTTVIGDLALLQSVKYVITLDADTRLGRDTAKELIGAMAHPLNKPEVKNGRVVKGYGILQPKINIDIESANTSFFSSVFAGQGGIDVYSGAVSDVYQDLFDEGIFTGKGIFDVDVFCELLPIAIPENTVLSHDLLEGSYLRCGLATDIVLVDGFPWKYSSYSARMHRWLRGDWQILPWLIGTVKNPLNAISKWKILDNLRRSVIPLFLSVIIFLSFNLLPDSSHVWFGFALASVLISLALSTIDWMASEGYRYIGQRCNAKIVYGLRGVLFEAFLLFILLPHYAYVAADAICRALWRMMVSKRKILEWVTAADADRKKDSGVFGYYRLMLPSCVFAAAMCVFSTKYHVLAYAISALWFASPLIMYYASRSRKDRPHLMKKEDRDFLIDIARRTWQYFDDFTAASDNYLTPDNYQEDPPNGLAHRTSPTNIGLELAAIVCAKDFGFITAHKAVDMTEKIYGTLQRLEKWNGHFYNWYNTKTLEVLRPRYISTVDSGNLCGYLIIVISAFLSIANEHEELAGRAKALADGFQEMYDRMNFRPLYDRQRDLFTIGYNAEEEHLTKSYYDLLSSEARMASFIAIAKGDIPKKHWFTLGRTLVTRDGYRGLVSWTGTMFEYLMPLILMKNIKNTLLDETYYFVIRAQRKYGALRGVPWGTSESGFNAFDIDLNYQYKAFGVPDLGLKRGLVSDMVVAPYASVMALMVDYEAAMANIRQLRDSGILGKYGLYEAIDYTPERTLPGSTCSVIKSYMVHHLGMSLLSVSNVLNDNILQKRFHANPYIKATEELLGERVPVNVIISKENREKVEPLKPIEREEGMCVRVVEHIDVNNPKAHMLSNGKMTVLLTDSGCGYSTVGATAVTRFTGDLQSGVYGNFVYIQDLGSKTVWTNTVAPSFTDCEGSRAVFSPHKAEFYRSVCGIDTTTEIIVSPEENAELRRVTIANHTEEDALLEITNYQEVILTTTQADTAHPAFSSLFVKTEYDETSDALIATRRTRDEKETPLYAMQTVCVGSEKVSKTEFETDRAKFLGRKHTVRTPQIIADGAEMTGTAGAVLDPVFSQRFRLKIEKGSVASFTIVTACCERREEALEIAQKYKTAMNISRAFDMAFSRSQVENKYLGISIRDEKAAYDILANVLYILPYRQRLAEYISQNTLGQQSLWSLGISGDNPIVTLRVYSADELDILRSLLQIHELWRIKGKSIDLVIISEDEGSYIQPLLTAIHEIISISHIRELVGVRGGIYILGGSILSPEVKNLVLAASRVVLHSNMGNISDQLEAPPFENAIPYVSFSKHEYDPVRLELGDVMFYNGYGGFAGGEYRIMQDGGNKTPLPWCNVVASPSFGFVVSESGGGYAWYHNSRENKLTPWTNDPVTDPPHEIIYMRDDECGGVWHACSAQYIVRHGIGYSVFDTVNYGIHSTFSVFVPENEDAKVSITELRNTTDTERSITLFYYLNPVLGASESEEKPFLSVSGGEHVMTVRNNYNTDYPGQTVYAACSEKIGSYTCDKREFFGDSRLSQTPNGLLRERFSGASGVGYDACVAMQCKVTLLPNERKTVVFSLGMTGRVIGANDACRLLDESKAAWQKRTGAIKINTPDMSMNLMVNSWLLYQTISCRIYARAAFYQCGGAYGFRDQLQDVLALLHADPELARAHIIRCAARQFVEGDVQHWWHEVASGFKGIRTKFSDDLLWLPYAVWEYMHATGDTSILDVDVPYIDGEQLCDSEHEKYCPALPTPHTGTIREHCAKALERAMKFGSHGLPLMGSGDWNDGMNKVGAGGAGESVWLGWFLFDIMRKFGYNTDALGESLNKAWDGSWYHRAYTDDGSVIGSAQSTECKIDAIAQAWSVISGAGQEDYQVQAMDSVIKHLVSREDGIIKLLTPPFDSAEHEVGYIKSYVPGVRENGGQYTHAAAWVIMAFAKLGMGGVAADLYAMINPVNHSRTPIEALKYKAEPYVIAADVYSAHTSAGRGGWTWYTGASGWMYRVATEWILGIKKQGDKLFINPCIPEGWKEFSFEYTYKDTPYRFTVKNPNGISRSEKAAEVALTDDGNYHNIEIIMQ